MKNNKRYWLIGGSIGLLVVILLFLISLLRDIIVLGYVDINLSVPVYERVLLSFIENISGMHLLIKGTMFGTQATELGSNIMIFIQIFLPILFGSLAGYIYGKSKNRKNI